MPVCILGLAMAGLLPVVCLAQEVSITLGWSAPEVLEGEPAITGFHVYYGTQPRDEADYEYTLPAGMETRLTVPNLARGQIYYFAVTASNELGYVSAYSVELSWAHGDRDTDTMQDAWEEAMFGVAAAEVIGDEDSDGDGITNADEFVAGTGPLDPNSRSALHISRRDGSLIVGFTVPQITGAGYEGFHRRVVLEHCASMGAPWKIAAEASSSPTQSQDVEYEPNAEAVAGTESGMYRIRSILTVAELPERPAAETSPTPTPAPMSRPPAELATRD